MLFSKTLVPLRYSLRARSRSGENNALRCFLRPSCRYTAFRYPERAQELFAKAEATAKAKYERLKKLVEFYNI